MTVQERINLVYGKLKLKAEILQQQMDLLQNLVRVEKANEWTTEHDIILQQIDRSP